MTVRIRTLSIVLVAMGAGAGGSLGELKGRRRVGLLLGTLLGPVGWFATVRLLEPGLHT